jgi:bacterioferritin-associated ferredoxin
VRLRVRLKFCGGCNPHYDRLAVARQIEEGLKGRIRIISSHPDIFDLVVAIQGCETACADLSAFEGYEIRCLTCIEDAAKFIEDIRAKTETEADTVKPVLFSTSREKG